ncbi:hypothetical protein [Oscillatoria sp. FACHB-1406]|uniref:hypothetical protein n=1 Tax=Oscillatoria sp. FACHB-1406 TaxID=2692846 RepID=UPI00168481FB|nr:hypothetical protein [Oscillatoria sp. FACHB-1406]MBD2578178.1 hypothetical protein [Oscillatoria sp. FACHB-1406]
MSDPKKPSKEQLLKAIEKLEKNPGDRVGILADVGIAAFGAAGAGALAAVFGAGATSIPIVTALTGASLVVAAPVTLVAGAAVAGGAAIFGITRLIKGSGYSEGKRAEILSNLKDRLKEVEAKERQSSLSGDDKTGFYVFLKEPLQLELISPEDARQLMSAVESGQIPIKEAYQLLKNIIVEAGKK